MISRIPDPVYVRCRECQYLREKRERDLLTGAWLTLRYCMRPSERNPPPRRLHSLPGCSKGKKQETPEQVFLVDEEPSGCVCGPQCKYWVWLYHHNENDYDMVCEHPERKDPAGRRQGVPENDFCRLGVRL